jgi:hypothetical protein
MYHFGLKDKKRESYRIDALLKFQVDNFAKENRLERQEVIARAVRFAHPQLSGSGGKLAPYAHLRRKKVDVVETTVITPKLGEETLNQIEDIKRSKGRSTGRILSWCLHLFFNDYEKKASGVFDRGALSTFNAPNFYLADRRIDCPWIEKAPLVPFIEHEEDLVPDRMMGRTVYVGADFFLTMMTVMEKRNGPRSRRHAGSLQVVLAAADGRFSLVTSAAEFYRMIGMGGALVEARDTGHFRELISSFESKGDFPRSGAPSMAGRMRCLRKMGIRVVPTDLEDYIGACEFMRTSSVSSLTTQLGLSTLAQLTPGDAVMIRFLAGEHHPAMLVWQEFSENGRLMRMSSRDIKPDPVEVPEPVQPAWAEILTETEPGSPTL